MNATVVSQPITASVSSAGKISVSVSAAAAVSSTASGGVGPQGPPGPTGEMSISASTDAELSGLASGDVLRYSSGKWRNHPDSSLTDGGNF